MGVAVICDMVYMVYDMSMYVCIGYNVQALCIEGLNGLWSFECFLLVILSHMVTMIDIDAWGMYMCVHLSIRVGLCLCVANVCVCVCVCVCVLSACMCACVCLRACVSLCM